MTECQPRNTAHRRLVNTYRPDRGQALWSRAVSLVDWCNIRPGLDGEVKVFDICSELPASLIIAARDEMSRLRANRRLEAVAEGAELTSLFRQGQALSQEDAKVESPGLFRLVQALEPILTELGYFMWRIRLSPPRLSSTTRHDDIYAQNWHFDSGEIPKVHEDNPVYQLIVNLGQQQRQFRFIPCSYVEIEKRLLSQGALRREECGVLPPDSVLGRFFSLYCTVPVTVPVPFGHCCAFAAGIYPHDGTKGGAACFSECGRFVCSDEDDFTLGILPIDADEGNIAHKPFFRHE